MANLGDETVLAWQKAQYRHDKRNHFDILSRHKIDRLKHYGLHFAKYTGRLARGERCCAIVFAALSETRIESVAV